MKEIIKRKGMCKTKFRYQKLKIIWFIEMNSCFLIISSSSYKIFAVLDFNFMTREDTLLC